MLFERFLHLLKVLEKAHVVAELRRRLRNAGQDIDHLRIDLARIGLTADRNHRIKPHLCGNAALHPLDLFGIAAKQARRSSPASR